MGGSQSDIKGEQLGNVNGSFSFNSNKDSLPQLKFDGEIEIFNVDNLFNRFIIDLDKGNYVFMATSKNYNEYGKVFWYKFGIAA